MTPVIYPATIITDFEKLCAVYPLIEQMRLEHNRVAELACSDPDKYLKTGKFRTYAKESKAKLKLLLAEQNRLKENIRWANYTPEQWKEVGRLSEEEQEAIYDNLFGNKAIEKAKVTEATSPLLDELKALDLDNLGETIADPTEDFTSSDWNNGTPQSDPNSRLTVTSSRVTWTGLTRNEIAYFYSDRGANHFDGDFEHLHEVYLTSCDNLARVFSWVLANATGGVYAIESASGDCLNTFFFRSSGGEYRLGLQEMDGGVTYNDVYACSVATLYYCTIERDENVGTYGTFYYYIYSDSGRTNLLDTLSIALHTSKKDFRYIYSVSSYNTGDSYAQSAYMQNLDLQEAGVTEKTGSDSGVGAESSEETAALAKSETGSGLEDILDRDLVLGETGNGADSLLALLAAVIAFETGSGDEQSLLSYLLSASDSGPGVEEAALIVVLVSGDESTGDDVSILPWLEAIFGGEEGSGFDALKALMETAGSGMRLHGRTGQVGTPSKGVNL